MNWIVIVRYENDGQDYRDYFGPFRKASSAQHFADRIGGNVQSGDELRFVTVYTRELDRPLSRPALARISAFLRGFVTA